MHGSGHICRVVPAWDCDSLFAQYTQLIHLGEYQPWLPIIGLEYGFFLGIVFGVIVGWKVCASRLRK
jgi:hypothetical protein